MLTTFISVDFYIFKLTSQDLMMELRVKWSSKYSIYYSILPKQNNTRNSFSVRRLQKIRNKGPVSFNLRAITAQSGPGCSSE